MAAKTYAKKTPEERAAQVRGLYDTLAAMSEELDDDDVLAIAERFDHYSANNALLIVAQCPHATEVHGYVEWQKRGRQVNSGKNSAITILKPHTREELDDSGRKVTKVVGMGTTSVFDISQTKPKDEES